MRPIIVLCKYGATCRWRWVTGFLCLLFFGAVGAGLRAQAASVRGDEPREGRQWAILVGVEKYYLAPNLLYTVNDVRQIGETLRRRGNCSEDRILEMIDTGPNARFQPLRASMMAELPRWLKKVAPEDRVLVYFTGHGFRGPDDKLYLAPIDCDPNNAASTGISVEWLHEQLDACKAEFKLLVIDACHAGCEKGDDDTAPVTAKELGLPFKNLKGVVTLASSTGDEKSLIWGDMQQSLFSYWLNQGLKGHADRNCDSAVTVDELYDYVHRNVTATAEIVFRKPQTPVRIIGPKVPGVPVVMHLVPYTLKGTLDDMAEQLAHVIELQQLSKVGVAEFMPSTADPKIAQLLGGDFGLLGRCCAEELERRLLRKMKNRTGKFDVVPHQAFHKALGDGGYHVRDLRTSAIKEITVKGKEVPVIALGRFCLRTGQVMTLKCDLVGTENQKSFGSAGGTALLNESEWAMLGRSVAVKPEDPPTLSAPSPDNPRPPGSDLGAIIPALDQRSEGAHPLLDLTFPFRVKILVNDQERKGVFQGNNMFVPLSKGEVYVIQVENHTEHPVFMRLLVDGLNTLPERGRAKSVTVEEVEAEATYLPAQRVNLTEARAWWVDGRPEGEEAMVYWVSGFFIETGEDAKIRQFKVVGASQSLAARQQFTEQMGLITAAFFQSRPQQRRTGPRSISPTVGTAFGDEYDTQTEAYTGDEVPGELLGVVHVRYVEPEVLQKIREDQDLLTTAPRQPEGVSP